LDYEIRKRQAAGEQTKDLEREKIMLLINSTKTELALIQQRIDARQKEMEATIGINSLVAKGQMAAQKVLFNEQKENLDSLIQDLEIFDIGERKRAMDEIARKKETSKKKTDIVKEEISEEDKLRKEQQDADKKAFDLKQKAIADEEAVTEAYRKRQLSAQQKELDDLNEKLNNELLAAGNNEELKLLLEEEYLAKKNAIVNKYIDLEDEAKKKQAQEELQRKLDNIDNVNNAAQQGADFLTNINSFFTKDSEKNAKREFQINKAKDLAGAVTNTAKGVTQALASSPPPLSFIQAAGIGILGGANIARIASARYGGGATGSDGSISIPNTASGIGGADVGAVTNTTTTIGGDSKVFVVESDITNTQNKVQTLENQSKL